MWGWRAPGSSREYDRQDLPQPPAPGACFPAYRSCEPVNSSYINSCCLLTYCRERRSWPWQGLSTGGCSPFPTQDLGRRGVAMGPTPTSGPTPSGRQGSGPQPLPPPVQGASTVQFTLLASVAGWDQAWGWKTGRGREAGRLHYPPHTHAQLMHTQAIQACAAPG